MNQTEFKKILDNSIVGVYRDETFHDIYPNFAPVKESLDTMTDADLQALHTACEDHICGWFPKFKSKSGGFKWTQEFCDAQYQESPEANKHHRAIAVGLCARTRNEIAIREKFKQLVEYSPLFYHKENWGKCVLFEYKGRTLMASSCHGYFVHDPNSYSLDQAKPRFK